MVSGTHRCQNHCEKHSVAVDSVKQHIIREIKYHGDRPNRVTHTRLKIIGTYPQVATVNSSPNSNTASKSNRLAHLVVAYASLAKFLHLPYHLAKS